MEVIELKIAVQINAPAAAGAGSASQLSDLGPAPNLFTTSWQGAEYFTPYSKEQSFYTQ